MQNDKVYRSDQNVHANCQEGTKTITWSGKKWTRRSRELARNERDDHANWQEMTEMIIWTVTQIYSLY